MMATAILMPKQGNTVEECVLTGWRVAVGDAVSEGDIIADIETDKAAFEVEATASGTLLACFWEEGDLVPVLVPLCAVGEAGEDASALAPDKDAAAEAPPAAEDASPPPAARPDVAPAAADSAPAAGNAGGGTPSPRARAFLADHPVDLAGVAGTGPDGRILEPDVRAAWEAGPRLTPVAAAMQKDGRAVPAAGTGLGGRVTSRDMAARPAAAAPTAPGSVAEKPLSNIRKIIAQRLHDSLAESAQYTLNAEADVTGILALRRRLKAEGETLGLPNLTVGDMILMATVKALTRHPEINAEFDGQVVREYSDVHVAFACDTPRGLMVPVIHNAHTMSLAQLSGRVRELATAAQDGALSPDLLAGGTFTVSNLGAFGVTTFTPVINAPQVGILGVGTTALKPVRDGDEVVHRDCLQLSLTLNHMVVDGAPGARFLQTLRGILENFDLVALAGQETV